LPLLKFQPSYIFIHSLRLDDDRAFFITMCRKEGGGTCYIEHLILQWLQEDWKKKERKKKLKIPFKGPSSD